MNQIFFNQQVRLGGLQRAVMAGNRLKHQGSDVMLTGARAGVDAALSRSGSPRLTQINEKS